jgi:hypothetical protein
MDLGPSNRNCGRWGRRWRWPFLEAEIFQAPLDFIPEPEVFHLERLQLGGFEAAILLDRLEPFGEGSASPGDTDHLGDCGRSGRRSGSGKRRERWR